jgi:DNA polymerase-1
MPNKPHLVIIDGLSFLFRAYHAVRPLNRSDGLPTNALYGFAQMLIKVVKDLQPDCCAVALDSKTPTFRDEMYPAYKAHRVELDEEMKQQLPHFEPLIAAFDISGLRVDGVEADDLIASLVKTYKNSHRITIVSSDKDLMQLLDDAAGVCMLDTMKDNVIDEVAVQQKFGVGPDKVIHVQALIGDSSDNVPGVPGIGPKTAAQLIGEFETLENLLIHINNVARPKLQQSLTQHADNARLSLQLVTLKHDVPLTVTTDQLSFQPDLTDGIAYLEQELEFNTLAKRLRNGNGQKSAQTQQKHTENVATGWNYHAYETVTTVAQLDRWIQRIQQAGRVAVDTETTSLNPHIAQLVGLSLATEAGAACYIPLVHKGAGGGDMFDVPQQLSLDEVYHKLGPLLADDTTQIIAQNLKYDWIILYRHGFTIRHFDDTLLMSAVLDAGRASHGLDELAKRYLNHTPMTYEDVAGRGKAQVTFDQVDIKTATAYAAEDADVTLRVFAQLNDRLNQSDAHTLKALYNDIEKPLLPILADMEMHGIVIDKARLIRLSQDFADRMTVVEQEVFALAGCTFNLNSPKQLADVLQSIGISGLKFSQLTVCYYFFGNGVALLSQLLHHAHIARGWRFSVNHPQHLLEQHIG